MNHSFAAKERILWMSATVILLTLLLLGVRRHQIETNAASAKINTILSQSAGYQERILALENQFLAAEDIATLRKRGLKSPVRDLITHLTKQRNLVPAKGVLGGTMGFYDRDAIRVLNRRWVFAPFDDGHISGQALLSYEVTPNGKIRWRVMESMMD